MAAGWEIDAHSLTHPDLTALDGAALTREVAGSRARDPAPLRRHARGSSATRQGGYDAEVVAAVRAAGFEGATTTEPGLARRAEPFTLARVRVDRGDGSAGLARKLAALGLPPRSASAEVARPLVRGERPSGGAETRLGERLELARSPQNSQAQRRTTPSCSRVTTAREPARRRPP